MWVDRVVSSCIVVLMPNTTTTRTTTELTYQAGDPVVLHNDLSGPCTTVIESWTGIVAADLGDSIEYHEAAAGGTAYRISTYIIHKTAILG